MKVKFAKKTAINTFDSITLINWLLRCTALSNVYHKGNRLVQSGSIIKIAIYFSFFGALNLIFMYYKIRTFEGNAHTGLVKFADSVQITYWISYFEYVIDMCCVYKYGHHNVLQYFKDFDKVDQMLGIPDYNKIRRTIFHTLILSLILCFASSFFDYATWFYVEGWKATTVYSIDYLYFFLNMLTVLDIISHVLQVEYRLLMLGDIFQGLTSPIKCVEEKNTSICCIENSTNKPFKTILFYKYYVLLHEQVTFLNTGYGFRVLIYCINLLINTINILNIALRIINGTMTPCRACTPWNYLPSIPTVIRAVNYGVMIVLLTYRCEQTYKQNERIVKIIDVLIVNQNNNTSVKADLAELRCLFIARPITFHAAKFFTVDYSLLVSMCSVVVTYTIIMLQSLQ